MDLFKAIFAESSAESSDSDTDTQPQKGGSSPQEAAASHTPQVSLTEAKQRKSRWQDLSAVTSQPLPTSKHPLPDPAGNLAGTVANIPAVERHTEGDKPPEITAAIETSKEVFGPILPPGNTN